MSPKLSAGRLALCAAVAIAVPGFAGAAANDYNYIEGGLIDRDDYHHHDLGGRVAGSVDFKGIAPFAEFSSNDHLDQLSAGAVFHAPIRHDINWFAGGSLEHVSFDHGHDTGFGLRGGVRWQVMPKLDLTPELRYVDVAHDGQVSARLTAAYAVLPRLDIVGAAQGGDDDRFEAGVRYRFGQVF